MSLLESALLYCADACLCVHCDRINIINSQVETRILHIYYGKEYESIFRKKRSNLMNLLIFLGNTEW